MCFPLFDPEFSHRRKIIIFFAAQYVDIYDTDDDQDQDRQRDQDQHAGIFFPPCSSSISQQASARSSCGWFGVGTHLGTGVSAPS